MLLPSLRRRGRRSGFARQVPFWSFLSCLFTKKNHWKIFWWQKWWLVGVDSEVTMREKNFQHSQDDGGQRRFRAFRNNVPSSRKRGTQADRGCTSDCKIFAHRATFSAEIYERIVCSCQVGRPRISWPLTLSCREPRKLTVHWRNSSFVASQIN